MSVCLEGQPPPPPPPIDVLIHTSQHFGVNQCSIGVCLILTSQDIENDNPGEGVGGEGGYFMAIDPYLKSCYPVP